MKIKKKYFLARITARLIDYLFLLFIANLFFLWDWKAISVLEMYISYNLLAALFKGKTIGKWAVRLEVKSSRFYNHFLREFFFFLLFPLVVIHFCFSSSKTLHEILSDSYLIRK